MEKEQELQRLETHSEFWLLLGRGAGRSCLDQVVALQANSAANPSWDALPVDGKASVSIREHGLVRGRKCQATCLYFEVNRDVSLSPAGGMQASKMLHSRIKEPPKKRHRTPEQSKPQDISVQNCAPVKRQVWLQKCMTRMPDPRGDAIM